MGCEENCNFVIISINDYLAFGPRYIHAFLGFNGIKAGIIFFKNLIISRKIKTTQKQEEDLLLGLLKELRPHIVGISVCYPYLKIAKDISLRIRNELKIPVLWGGAHPTIMPEECIQTADMVCIGEGEYPTLELMRGLLSHEDISDIDGIWVRKGEYIVRNPPKLNISDLDSLPSPGYAARGKYFIEANCVYRGDPASYEGSKNDNIGSWRKGYITFKNQYFTFASRGCPYSCAYCCNSITYNNQYRTRSAVQVIDEISAIRGTFPDIKRIQFYDAIFPWDRKWVYDFCLEYKKRINLPFYVISYFDLINEENIEIMKWAGLDSICFGVESGSEKIRKEVYKKSISNESIVRVANLLHRKKILPYYSFIVDNPFEKDKEKQEALSLLLRLPRPFIIGMHALYLFPKTAITEEVFSEFREWSGLKKEAFLEKQAEGVLDFINRPIEDIFWHSILSLSAKSFMPRRLVRGLFNSKVLRRHPRVLYFFALVFNYLKFIIIGIVKLLRCEISIKNVKNNISFGQFTSWFN